MPDVADSALEVTNNALYLMGDQAITSFTDGSAQAEVANALYEDVVNTALSNHRWRFASKQRVLTRMSVEPEGKWDVAYRMPGDLVHVISVTVNDYPIKYDIYGDKVYCNASEADSVVMDYIYRPDESAWPSTFKMAVKYSLASEFAIALARDNQLASLMAQKSNFNMAQARRIDSQQQTTRKLHTSRFIAERRS